MKTQTAEQTARQNAELKVEFRTHLLTYIAVNTLLAAINLILTPEYLWFIWPLSGWGLGLIIHGINVRTATNSSFRKRMIEKEMQKAGLIISLLVLGTSIHAQENAALSGTAQQPEVSYSGYGGPLFLVTGINNELGFCVGGKGGAVLSENLAFGGLGFGTVNPVEFTGDNLSDNLNSPLAMSFGAGGVFFEYIFNYGDRIEFSIPLNIMAGGVHVYDSNTETEIESTALFILEPGVNIDFQISQFYTQSIFISYRQSFGSTLTNLENTDISGVNVGMIFKFGK